MTGKHGASQSRFARRHPAVAGSSTSGRCAAASKRSMGQRGCGNHENMHANEDGESWRVKHGDFYGTWSTPPLLVTCVTPFSPFALLFADIHCLPANDSRESCEPSFALSRGKIISFASGKKTRKIPRRGVKPPSRPHMPPGCPLRSVCSTAAPLTDDREGGQSVVSSVTMQRCGPLRCARCKRREGRVAYRQTQVLQTCPG